MKEIWKDIRGYEELYQVSNLGRIKSLHFGPKNVSNLGKPKIMKTSKSSTGYFHIQLYKNGKPVTKLVHILVASAFVENPSNNPEVNHIDGNKSNNCCSNLEWVTKSENLKHADRIGLRVSPMKGITGAKHPYSKPVLQYDLDGNFIKKWDSRGDAARHYGIDKVRINSCIYGRNKTCLNYMWLNYSGGDIPLKIEPVKRRSRS